MGFHGNVWKMIGMYETKAQIWEESPIWKKHQQMDEDTEVSENT